MHIHNYSKEAKASNTLFVTTWIVYTLSCFIKSNYTASIAYIVSEGIYTKTNAGIISAAFYLLYGLAQIFFGKTTDKVSPFTLFTVGTAGAIIANLILCFTNNFWCVLIVWTLCGLVQFGVWPAASRIVTQYLIPEHRQKATLYISLCMAISGFMSFLLVTFILETFGWSGVFVLNTASLVFSLVLWLYVQAKTEKTLSHFATPKTPVTYEKSDVKFLPLFFSTALFFGAVILLFKTMLDNGAKTWIPTMIMESYNISPTVSGVITALIFIFNMGCLFPITRWFRKIKNEYTQMLICFSVCIPALIAMQFTGILPVWLIVLSMIIITTMMYATTNTIVLIAAAYRNIGYTGTATSLINAAASFGVVIASFGYGYLSEHFGWGAVTGLWLVIAIISVILSLVSIRSWNKFKKSQGV